MHNHYLTGGRTGLSSKGLLGWAAKTVRVVTSYYDVINLIQPC